MASGALKAKIRAGGEGLNADSAVPCRRRLLIVEASQQAKKLRTNNLMARAGGSVGRLLPFEARRPLPPALIDAFTSPRIPW
jgi:hypothetical protein